MKKTLHLCLLTILSLFILTGCKEDPEAMNNIPTLILEDPTDLTRTSVTLHGSIKTNYPQQIKEYGFRFSSSIDFSSSDTRTIPVEEGSLIDVSTLLTDLNIGETYFYVLYVSTGGEPLLSDVQSLIMPTRSLATLTEPQQVAGTLTFEATITDDGGSPINSVGFCWSTTPNPTIFTGEHLFADFTEETTFSATLNQLETSTTYYVRAFAESDVTGSGTMALAYSPSITLQTAEAPTLRPYELATGVTSLTFGIEAEHAETICWKALPKSEYKGTLSAGEIIDGGNSVPGAEAGEVRCEGLNPDTEYVVVAAAENGGFSTVSTPLEMKTRPVPTIKTAVGEQTPLSVTCSIATTDGDMVKWLLLPFDDSKEPESITPEVLAEQGMDAEVNTTALVSCEDLTPETHYILHAAVWSGDYAVQATPLRMMTSAKPTISLTAGSCTAESITFSVTSANADQVHWMILPQSALNQPYEITAEMVLGSENTVAANQTVKVTATDLTLETTYTIYAAAEKEGVAVLSDKLVMATEELPETWKICYTSTDGEIITPNTTDVFGANIVSNTYENGQGTIFFDGPVTSIGGCAFYGCTNLTSVTIPDSVTEIGECAFLWCDCLISITIPDSVTEIGTEAFLYCENLTAFYGKYASEDNRCLIVNGVLNAFAPAGLTSYTIPDGVTSIGVSAFNRCSGLKTITIPESVISIGEYAFCDCSGLTAFYGKYTSEDNRCLIVDEVLNAFAPAGLTSYSIPDGVTKIGENAFHSYSGLNTITIPESVTSIGGGAFYDCSGLTSVYCKPTTPPTGGWPMFEGNASGRKIYVPNGSVVAYRTAEYWIYYAAAIYNMDGEDELPETWKICYTSTDGKIVTPYRFTTGFGAEIVSNTYENGQGVITFNGPVTEIGENAFHNCSGLNTITIPESVTSIGGGAFWNCTGLTSVYCKPTTPPTGGTSMFRSNASVPKIYVPKGSVEAYKAATGWSDYADAIVGYDF